MEEKKECVTFLMLRFLAALPGQVRQSPGIKVVQAIPQAIGDLGEVAQNLHLAIATLVMAIIAIAIRGIAAHAGGLLLPGKSYHTHPATNACWVCGAPALPDKLACRACFNEATRE